MVMTQCGACAICSWIPDPEVVTSGSADRLYVHHSHVTGDVIALVCNRCNIAMGNFGDNSDKMRRAALINEGG